MARKTLALTIERMVEMSNALASLDGRAHVDQDGKAVQVMFAFGALRLDLARNANTLRGHLIAFEEARKRLIEEHGQVDGEERVPVSIDATHPNWWKFVAAVDEMAKKPEDVELVVIPRVALKLEVNEIPIPALAALDDLIED